MQIIWGQKSFIKKVLRYRSDLLLEILQWNIHVQKSAFLILLSKDIVVIISCDCRTTFCLSKRIICSKMNFKLRCFFRKVYICYPRAHLRQRVFIVSSFLFTNKIKKQS
ncbi:hypothetical protein KIL84_015301 [Mauremys mutica]|uniref:Uncharacterized protein n=1 Tax=Mauremys mutica TaxID=74926 RepID=A0A9D3WQH1_9SAUR|nr:hypothetical protein KIL84_015301 [Mauremys mutica]